MAENVEQSKPPPRVRPQNGEAAPGGEEQQEVQQAEAVAPGAEQASVIQALASDSRAAYPGGPKQAQAVDNKGSSPEGQQPQNNGKDDDATASQLAALVGASLVNGDGGAITPPNLPERPKLAEGIELMGEMKESAFKDPPWLASRNGKFLQITEVLHRIAEHATGDKTVEDIARAVSRGYERQVDAAEVSQLLATNLIPAGIVEGADGPAQEQSSDGPSPLQVQMKMKMLPPAAINIFTGALSVLYWPPVLIAVLIAAFATQYWVFFVHGLGSSLHETFFESGMLLAVLGIVVASAAFHEFGHAAALRAGGGRVGGMGAGLYIVYPAFYTDVTDNYRLPRWSRVRTDLGGFYFNLIFGLGLTGLYFLTGEEVFLIGIAIIDFEIVHQLLPFIRLDGYWALADITGIPDFFSQIRPFLRSQLPGWVPFPKGQEMPPLKTWAKLFFWLYIVTMLPLLLFLFFLIFRTLPRIIATAASAFAEQAETLPDAVNNADVLLVIGTLLQMILLVLPAIGATYLFARLTYKFLHGVWNWSQPTPQRRVTGALATTGFVALIAYLWIPQIALPELPGVGRPVQETPPLIGRFEPIREDERFTIREAVGNEPPPPARQGGEDEQPRAAPDASPTPSGSPTPALTPAITPTVAPVLATPVPTTAPSRPTPVPTVAASPTPAQVP